jgi:hypothetical protein
MSSAGAAFAVAAVVVGAAALVASWGVNLPHLLAAVGLALLVVVPAYWGPRLLGALRDRARERLWREEEGQHHSFGGVSLRVQDDGRHLWLAGEGLKRVLDRREADEVLAARISGKWKLDERQGLWLRVDGVVEHLAVFPGRTDPRVQKFRRWLQRDVIDPAERRHRVAAGRPGAR